MPHIFEPFERESNTTMSGVYGVGLGLPIAKSIIEMLGGKIEVTSKTGVGSTFSVVMGLRTPKTEQKSADIDAVVAAMAGKKILIVEDNEINSEIETEILSVIGFDVDTAENGEIAVKKLKSKNNCYELVLMDIQMPVMDGRDATKAIRRLKGDKANIPIIALSANALEQDVRMSLDAGMDAHLAKPIDVPKLLAAFAETLAARGKI